MGVCFQHLLLFQSISPDIHCHLPEKSQSSTAGTNGAPISVPLSLGYALYIKVEFGFISKLSKEAASYSLISDIFVMFLNAQYKPTVVA
jgi:hypothetical protein